MIKNFLRVGLILAVIIGFSGFSLAMGQLQFRANTVGEKAKVFSLKDTNGNTVDTEDFIGKKPVILFFWTTWCPHCRAQMGHLKDESENIKNAGAELILVDIEESRSHVSSFLNSIGSPFVSLLDEETKVAGLYNIIGVPTFVIVDKSGTIKLQDNSLPSDYQKILAE